MNSLTGRNAASGDLSCLESGPAQSRKHRTKPLRKRIDSQRERAGKRASMLKTHRALTSEAGIRDISQDGPPRQPVPSEPGLKSILRNESQDRSRTPKKIVSFGVRDIRTWPTQYQSDAVRKVMDAILGAYEQIASMEQPTELHMKSNLSVLRLALQDGARHFEKRRPALAEQLKWAVDPSPSHHRSARAEGGLWAFAHADTRDDYLAALVALMNDVQDKWDV